MDGFGIFRLAVMDLDGNGLVGTWGAEDSRALESLEVGVGRQQSS